MGFLLIIPILAFDIWLALTTGKRAFREMMAARKYPKLGLMVITGIVIAVWFTFFAQYNMGKTLRLISFPVPSGSFRLENEKWVSFVVPQPYLFFGQAANFITGLIIPFIPFKIAEFLRAVKQELR